MRKQIESKINVVDLWCPLTAIPVKCVRALLIQRPRDELSHAVLFKAYGARGGHDPAFPVFVGKVRRLPSPFG